jgi:Protein of unknown function (DUF3619)
VNIKAIDMPPGHAQALEARFGWRVAAQLSHAGEALPHDVTERLRFARGQALAVARTRLAAASAVTQPATAEAGAVVGWTDTAHGAAASLGGGAGRSGWTWLGIAVPALALVIGLIGIEAQRHAEQISVAAEIDAALLGDALPPVAYTDPGFAEFLLEPLNPLNPLNPLGPLPAQ